MLRVGLTGGIGSGKSTVSAMFREVGFNIIDADLVAREVLNIYPEILDTVKKEFGETFFENGVFKRREFGNYIFKYPRERIKYEGIILPYIKNAIFNRFDYYENSGEKLVILDAPTLIENNLHKEMDYNVLVYVGKDAQISRVMERDKLTHDQSLLRINSQLPLEEKTEWVNFIIDNSGDIINTKEQVLEIANVLKLI